MNDFLQRLILARLKAGAKRVLNEPVAVMAGLVAAVSATTDLSWRGYGLAAGIFIVRFFVTGPDGTDIGLAKPRKARRARARTKRTVKKAA